MKRGGREGKGRVKRGSRRKSERKEGKGKRSGKRRGRLGGRGITGAEEGKRSEG